MDEAIHSLVFVPPAERYSWWGKLQQESRRGLKRVEEQAMGAGYDVRIKQLSGLYADICALSKDDRILDFRFWIGDELVGIKCWFSSDLFTI